MESSYIKPNGHAQNTQPFQAEAASMYGPPQPQSQAQAQKRRPSNDTHESSIKRQKVEPPSETAEFDLEALLAQVTAGSTLPAADTNHHQHQRPESPAPQDAQVGATIAQSIPYDPNLYMWVMSLPILENLSIQLLSTLAQTPYSETINIIRSTDSEHGQAYAILKSLFCKTKEIYSKDNVFLSADDLGFTDFKHRSIIRNTNMATFVSGVFGGSDVGFYELNNWFLNTFTPENETIDAKACSLCTNLKTQMYLSALTEEDNEKTKEEILDDLFPPNLAVKLMTRHPNLPLSESESEFVMDCRARKDYLLSQPSDAESIQSLSEQFPWENFLNDLSLHINEAYEGLLRPYMKKHDLPTPTKSSRATNKPFPSIEGNQSSSGGHLNSSFMASADKAAQEALLSISAGNMGQSQSGDNVQQYYSAVQSQNQSQSYQSQQTTTNGNIPYHTQSAPTQVLYNLARQAAVAKSNPGNARQPGPPSQRRPWSTEEENALMAGLDRVKGPHWSQILALYGEKGTINNILEDRNQVQLKDKARNLKLFFLKSNIEVPYYLQSVTGELKTRAPSQAARKEAEEKAASEKIDEQAHFNGIMALGRGLQDKSPAVDTSNAISTPRSHQSGGDSPEQFHVTDPHAHMPHQAPPQPPQQQISDDDRLVQQLIAATAETTNSLGTAMDMIEMNDCTLG